MNRFQIVAAASALLSLLSLGLPGIARADDEIEAPVQPRRYVIRIEPDAAALTFTGAVEVEVETGAGLRQIDLHAAELTVSEATIDGKPVETELLGKEERLRLKPGKALAAGRHQIRIRYAGRIRQAPYGLFAVDYADPDGTRRRLLATQFEATDARRFVPCIDQPDKRSVFELSVLVPAADRAISNMPAASEAIQPGGKRLVRFQPTPPMSSYLLAFALGDFESIETKVGKTDVRVLATRGYAERGRFALNEAAALLSWYENYFGAAYPMPKLDMLGIPGNAGFQAMENWGATIFFEYLLLFDPATQPESQRQQVFVTIAHEIAHQWFGNLVTMRWWSDLWLNEGFATWMQYRVADKLHPDWQMGLQGRHERDTTMRRDALGASHAVVQDVDSANEANAAFDDVTYEKGHAVVRAIEAQVGEDRFRDALRRYFRTHAMGTATTKDLWAAMRQQSGADVQGFAAGLIERPGIPLLRASQQCTNGKGTLSLHKTVFRAEGGSNEPEAGVMPLAIAEPGKPARLLTLHGVDTALPVPCAPMLVNQGDRGYLRTLYDAATFAALRDRFATLSDADQLVLLGDGWALADADLQPAGHVLEMIARLSPDAAPATWQLAGFLLSELDALAGDTPLRASLRRFAIGRFQQLLQRGEQPGPSQTAATARLRRETAIEILGTLDEPDTVARGLAALDRPPVDPAVATPLLRVGGAHADAARYAALLARAVATYDRAEQMRLYEALAGTRDPALAATLLAHISDGTVPQELRSPLLTRLALVGKLEGPSWEFLQSHAKEFGESADAVERFGFAASLVSNSSDPASADRLEQFAQTNVPADARQEVRRTAAEIRHRAAAKGRLLAETQAWLAAHPVLAAPR